jgi:hypothetical protein
MSTSGVDTWQTVNIWTEKKCNKSTKVVFIPKLTYNAPMKQNENSSTKFKKAENSGTNKVFNPKKNSNKQNKRKSKKRGIKGICGFKVKGKLNRK